MKEEETSNLLDQIKSLRDENQKLRQAHEDANQLNKVLEETKHELSQSRRMLKTILDHIPLKIYWKDLDLKYLGGNQAFLADARISDNFKLMGKTDSNLDWKESASQFRKDDDEVLKTNEAKLNYKELRYSKTDRVKWLQSSKIPLFNEEGKLFGLLGMYQDVTEVMNEQHIKERAISELKLLEEIISNSPSVAFNWNNDNRWSVEFVSQNIELWGYKQQDFYSGHNNFRSIIHKDDIQKFSSLLGEHTSDELFYAEFRICKKDGDYVWVKSYIKQIFDNNKTVKSYHSVISDISILKEAEMRLKTQYEEIQAQNEEIQAQNEEFFAINEELKQNLEELHELHDELSESEAKFKAISEQSNLPITIIQKNQIVYINETFIRLFDLPDNEVIQWEKSRLFEHVFTTDSKKVLEIVNQASFDKKFHYHLTAKSARTASDEYWFNVRASYISLHGVDSVLVTLIDITTRKNFNETIRELYENLSVTLNCIGDGVIVMDKSGVIKITNPVAEKLLNEKAFQRSTNLSERLKLKNIPFDDFYNSLIEKAVKSCQPVEYPEPIEIINKDNDALIVSCHVSPVINDNEVNGIVLVLRDITENLRIEEELKDSKKWLEARFDHVFTPDTKLNGFELKDIFDIEYLQQIQDTFSKANNITSYVTSPDGELITYPKNFSKICSLIWKTDKGRTTCIKTCRLLGEKAFNSLAPEIENCKQCGLTHAISPIVVAGKHIANWVIGQVDTGNVKINKVITYSESLNIDKDDAKNAIEQVPLMSLERFQEISNLLWLMTKNVSTTAYNNLKLAYESNKSKEAVQASKASEKMLRSIIDNSTEGIAVINEQGIIVEWNKALEKTSGYLKDEIFDHYVWDINEILTVTDNNSLPLTLNKQVFEEYFSKIKAGNFIHSIEFDVKTKNGSIRKVLNSIFPVYNGNELLIGIIANDITEKYISQEELRKNRQLLQNILDNSPVAIYVKNLEGKFEMINKTAEEIFEKKKDEILGYPIEEIFDGNYKVNVRFSDDTNRDSKPLEYEERILTYNKEKVLLTVKTPFQDEIDGTTKVIGISMDITDRVQAQAQLKESEELYRQLITTSPEAIILSDLEGRMLFMSPQTRNLFKIDEHTYRFSHNIMHYVHPNEVEDVKESIKEILLTGIGTIKRFRFVCLDGSEFYGEVNSAIVHDHHGNPKSLIYVIRDISARKQFEEEIIRAKEKAEESDRLKSSFLANMSHEIRTPMNAIIGFANLLQDEVNDVELRNEYVQIISTNSTTLLHLIDDIIDFAKIESNQLKMYPVHFNVDKLLVETKFLFDEVLRSKNKENVELILDKECLGENLTIYADPIRVRQILVNLVGNAVKFTEKGYIKFGYVRFENSFLKFYIEDTGIGLSKEKQEVIFERFRQADDSYTRKYGGTGLGLAISRNLVKMIGGEIWVESEENKGARFYFTIPLLIDEIFTYSSVNETTAKINPQTNWQGKTILIAEDEPVNFFFIKETLKNTGVQFIHACDGLKAIEAVRTNPDIDLVLMDIKMPEMNGFEATKEIKKIRKNLPIIAQTAFAMEEDRKNCLEAGCDDYISKPIRNKELIGMLSEYFG